MDIPPELIAAQQALVPIVMAIPGVIGCDIGFKEENGVLTDEIVLRVLVADLANVPPGIPETMSGFAVNIIQRNPQILIDLTRFAPVVGGSSISNPGTSISPVAVQVNAGTLGGIARENNTGELRGITNEHVVQLADVVFQPEAQTSPPPSGDRIGTVIRTEFPTTPQPFPPFRPMGELDAACLTIERAALAEITEIGAISGSAQPQLNDPVRKRGRTTGLTHGTITALHGNYPNRNATLIDQMEITVDADQSTVFCDHGDSGSLIVKEDTGEVVGLLWGGDDDPGGSIHGLACDIQTAETILGISFSWPIPQVSSVNPSQVSSAGGDQVTIGGNGFQLATSVEFGGTAATSFTVQNDQLIEATVPPGSGTVSVIVTAPGGSSDPLISATVEYV